MVCVVWLPTAPPVVGQCRRRSALAFAAGLVIGGDAHLVRTVFSA